MALSFSIASSLRFSVVRPYRSESLDQTKAPINITRTSHCFSSNWSLIRSRSLRHHGQKFIKRIPIDFYLQRATPIRAYSGEDGFIPPSERSLHFRQVVSFMRPQVLSVLFVQFFTIVAGTWMRYSHLTQSSAWSFQMKTIAAFVAIACAQVFTNGINQIYDVEMDRVNKPFLPIASGKLSKNNAWLTTVSFAIVSLLLAGCLRSGPLLVGIGLIIFMGYAYNIPPLTMKFSTYGAIFAIALTSGFLNLLCAHSIAKAALGLPFQISPYDAFTIIITTIMAATNGFLKDLMDFEGDTMCNVPTLATKLGIRKTTYLGVGVYLMTYIGGILAAISMPQAFKSSIIVPAHILFSFAMIFQVWKLEKGNYAKVV